MRDIRTTDRFGMIDGKPVIVDEHGTIIPLVFKSLQDWAAWWTRQAELNVIIKNSIEWKRIFAAIFRDS